MLAPVLLTIAGTDPSGGAGLQADLKVFTTHECYGMSVCTALVAQNTTGVQDIVPTSPEFVTKQLVSVLGDIPPAAFKTGMLTDTGVIKAMVETLKNFYTVPLLATPQSEIPGTGLPPLPPLVVDPVTVSTSGHTLLPSDAIEGLLKYLIPMATIITPNVHEARLLLSHLQGTGPEEQEIKSVADMVAAARKLTRISGVSAALVKGGHLIFKTQDVETGVEGVNIEWAQECDPEGVEVLRAVREARESSKLWPPADQDLTVDVLYCAKELGSQTGGHEKSSGCTLFVRPRIQSTSTHGTGCTLSAAIACHLARRVPVVEAVRLATIYTHTAIATAPGYGRGHGPLHHTCSITQDIIPKPTPYHPHPFLSAMVRRTKPLWDKYVRHPFVVELGKGILAQERFAHFCKQDYHYLKHYARAHGLLGAKSSTFEDISAAATISLHAARESRSHVVFCNSFGITLEQLEAEPESAALSAYARYILDVGLEGDSIKLWIAVVACLVGYGEVGLWLARESKKSKEEGGWVVTEGNPYKQWIDAYNGKEYQDAVRVGIEALESRIAKDPPSRKRLEDWATVWETCVKLEIAFWDMSMNISY